MSAPIESFAKRLKIAMEEAGLSQSDICKAIDFSRSTMTQYLQGKATPKTDRTYLIANLLNVDPVWLIGYDVPMRSNSAEQKLLANFKQLNNEGQKMLVNYSEFLLQDHKKE